jgi:hypothetical protein
MTDWARNQTPDMRDFTWATETVTSDLPAAKLIELE